MAMLAVKDCEGPNPDILQERRRRLGKAYADGAFTDDEYNRRLAEIDFQLHQTISVTTPDIEEAIELFSDIPMLWNEATTDERRRLLGTLVEKVYVDMETKHVTALKPTPVFRSLFGTGIDVGPGAPIDLQALNGQNKDIVGDGGDGGESNSPSRRSYPEYATSLVSSFILPGQSLLTGPGQASRFYLSPLLIGAGAAVPQLNSTPSRPIGVRPRGMCNLTT